MTKSKELIPFILLIIGTLGLLLNEFIFSWGRAATLTFAAANVIGLLILGFALWRRPKGQ
jgi:hypothetical protein